MMKHSLMLAALLPFLACDIPWPDLDGLGGGREGEAEGECGECTSDEDCLGGRCQADACLPSCDCPACDVCAGHCERIIPCGGIAGIPCPPGYECVDDPNDDCDPARGGADCGGICVPGDDCVCPTLWDPVCGADGLTYGNECEAKCAGVPVRCPGECPCGTGSCGDGVCDPATPSTMGEDCRSCPQDCGPCDCEPDPLGEICDDGIDNDCDGLVDEDCRPMICGGFGGIPCPPGYECVDDPNDECDPATGADCPGICVPSGGACGDGVCDPGATGTRGETCETCPEDCGPCDCEPDPLGEICGDGIDNDCDGFIDEDCGPMMCAGIGGWPCPPGYECIDDPSDDCFPERGDLDCAGICVPSDDCVCPTLWDPVCGVDGVTYSNECEARCQGVPVECAGECPCESEPGHCGDGVCDPGTLGTRGETCETCPEDCGPCDCEPDPLGELCGDGIDNDCDGFIDEGCGDGPECGGFAGIPCPPGYECVDDPSDDCDMNDPSHADCAGICVPIR